jgi:hypothetical protein
MFRVDGGGVDETSFAPAATLSVGRELDHAPARSISLAARVGLGVHDDDDDGGSVGLFNIAAVVGWHWY